MWATSRLSRQQFVLRLRRCNISDPEKAASVPVHLACEASTKGAKHWYCKSTFMRHLADTPERKHHVYRMCISAPMPAHQSPLTPAGSCAATPADTTSQGWDCWDCWDCPPRSSPPQHRNHAALCKVALLTPWIPSSFVANRANIVAIWQTRPDTADTHWPPRLTQPRYMLILAHGKRC